MTYTITVVINENDAIITLVDADGKVVAVGDAVVVRDLARDFWRIVDALCEDAGITRDAITGVRTKSVLGDSAITQRAMRAIEHVFAYAREARKS